MRLRDVMIAVIIESLILAGWFAAGELILPAPRISIADHHCRRRDRDKD